MYKEEFKKKHQYRKNSKYFVCKTPKLCKYLQELGFTFNKCIPDRKNPFYNVWIFTNSDELYNVVEDYFATQKYNKY